MGKKIQCIGRYALEGHLLGKGSFARVELAHHSVTGCKVAIKIIDTRKLKEEYQKNNLQREARIMGQLRHPNIVRLYETLKATTLHCLVMEYASGGELQAFIKLQKDFRLSEDRGRPYIRQMVSALHYLHERGVAHRDLKMENIMLDTPKKNIKLVDFGLSNTFSKDELMKTHCGSPEYAAPELFTAGEKYGLEIDIWSMGIVMYAMLVGKLPFTTPYTDQYRRQKLVQQMEKGLVDVHQQEMIHLTPDCQDLLRKLIEPSPSLRLPLLDMEIHPWITENAKTPFFPFQSFPRDKNMKMQMQDSISSLEEDETLEELATALGMKKEILEQKVAENKSDEMSAMFNMILDRKRQQQGVFDVDHTLKSEKKETKGKRSKSTHTKSDKAGDKKHTSKGAPPALVLTSDDLTAESAPHSGNEPDHETKFSSFDFLALCSTPTWLGPERRKSRRRSRSPMPSPHIQQHGTQGDYMERQAIEMEREQLREERAAAGLLSPNSASQGHPNHHNHVDQHAPVTASLSVPGSETPTSSQLALRRSSSFKLSRRRARSCGPSHRRKSSFQRSGSVDHHHPDKEAPQLATSLASTKEGSSAPAITGDSILRGITKTSSLKMRQSRRGSGSIAGQRRGSVDIGDSSKNLLGVPRIDMQKKSSDTQKKNLLTVPQPEPMKKNLLEVPEVDYEGSKLLKVPSIDLGSTPHLDNSILPTEDTSMSMSLNGSKSITRPGKLTLKECYPPSKEDKHPAVAQGLPLVKPAMSGANGPLTSVEVHYVDSSNPSSSTDLLQPCGRLPKKIDSLDIPNSSAEGLSCDSHISVSHMDHNERLGHDDSSSESFLNLSTRSKYTKPHRLSLLETSSSSFASRLAQVPLSNTNQFNVSSRIDDGAIAMQIEDKSNVLCNSSENRVLLGAECAPLPCDIDNKEVISDLHLHFDGLIISSDGFEENEDHVDSMTALISDSFKHEILANAKPSSSTPVGIGATQKVSRQNSAPTPDEDLPHTKVSSRKGSGSAGSFTRSSGSGRRSGSGKLKSPTTPTWMNLKTPLARIESFHSDDFDCLAESDNEEQASPSASPMSVTTPTVPCFAYKLHMMKKKQTKLKQSSSKNNNGCGSVQNRDFTSSKLNSTDRKLMSSGSGGARLDATATDPLLSSGSETEHHDDGQERLGAPGKAKIHPMGADDKDADLLSKSDTKCLPYTNAITRQPNQIKNSISKCPKIIPNTEQGGRKKAFVKNLAWRKSFAQFLKRKRYHSPVAMSAPQHHQQQQQQQQQQQHPNQPEPQVQQPQQQPQQPSPSNNNNNDFAPVDPLPVSRNGTSALGQSQNKVTDVSAGIEDYLVTSSGGENCKMATTALSSVPVENSVTELIELQSSPKLHCSSSPTSHMFDFSLAHDSPKMKSSCLLGWGSCRDCGRGDASSEEDIECFSTLDPTAVSLNLKPLGDNTVQENMNFTQTYHFSST